MLENGNFDVNLAPDKRTIMINEEDLIFSWIKEQVLNMFTPFRQSELIYGADNTELVSCFEFSSQPDLTSSSIGIDSAIAAYSLESCNALENSCVVDSSEKKSDYSEPTQSLSQSNLAENFKFKKQLTQSNLKSLFGYQADTLVKKNVDNITQPKKKQKSLFLNKDVLPKKLKRNSIFPLIQGDFQISVSVEDIVRKGNTPSDKSSTKSQFKAEISDFAEAEAELSRFVSKQDFKRMKVLGQFNLGFIIVSLDSDLFVIDQHARYITLQCYLK